MSIVVVGSVAFDSLKTPYGTREKILGGAATHFSLSASYFTDVRVVAVVGEDFTQEDEAVMTQRGVDTRGIQHAKGKSFFWKGEYGENVNEAKTLDTQLNVFESFDPKIPAEYRDSEYLFLANIDPALQVRVRDSMKGVKLVGGDTMNFWISSQRQNLGEMLKRVDVLLINDGEAKMLAGDTSLPRAAHKVLEMGPKALVIKHGEYGATIFFRDGRVCRRAPSISCSGAAAGRGARSDGRGRQFCRRLHGLHRVPRGSDAPRVEARHVLRQRHGVVFRRALRHRAAAEPDARRNRRAVQCVS